MGLMCQIIKITAVPNHQDYCTNKTKNEQNKNLQLWEKNLLIIWIFAWISPII